MIDYSAELENLNEQIELYQKNRNLKVVYGQLVDVEGSQQITTYIKGLFGLGMLVQTPGILDWVKNQPRPHQDEYRQRSILLALMRHQSGDWGEQHIQDFNENEKALKDGYRIMSVYVVDKERIWIITEWNREITTVLLPSEY